MNGRLKLVNRKRDGNTDGIEVFESIVVEIYSFETVLISGGVVPASSPFLSDWRLRRS